MNGNEKHENKSQGPQRCSLPRHLEVYGKGKNEASGDDVNQNLQTTHAKAAADDVANGSIGDSHQLLFFTVTDNRIDDGRHYFSFSNNNLDSAYHNPFHQQWLIRDCHHFTNRKGGAHQRTPPGTIDRI